MKYIVPVITLLAERVIGRVNLPELQDSGG